MAGETVTLTLSPESSIASTLVAGEHLDAQLLVRLGQLGRDLRLLQRHHPVEELDDGHLDAVVGQHVRELDADRAGAGDDDRLRQLVGHDLLLVGHHPVAQRGAGQQPGGRAGRDDAVVEGDRLGRPVGLDAIDVWSSVKVPQPSISVTLFFFIRKCTPLTIRSATVRLRLYAAPKSKRHVAADAERLRPRG